MIDDLLRQGRPSYGGMTHVASLKFQEGELLEIPYNVMQRAAGHDQKSCVIEISGGGELLEILYNVMQRAAGHDQRTYYLSHSYSI